MNKYIINIRFKSGDTVYYNHEGQIISAIVDLAIAILKPDGTHAIMYRLPTGKKKWNKDVVGAVDDDFVFATPDEVAKDILKRFKADKRKAEQEKKAKEDKKDA